MSMAVSPIDLILDVITTGHPGPASRQRHSLSQILLEKGLARVEARYNMEKGLAKVEARYNNYTWVHSHPSIRKHQSTNKESIRKLKT
ncbi:hypothetical protein DPMN_136643 [Dreissena polymorpha]|uniref:Uncharacterized protein n=1 Tax=Dreissena polymorpha TaxID=45954 RepID=A0A9D4G469_DREPO|nr:hypothetical protein DPMN_136643 [Dreissena polymorpha]